MSDTDVKPDLVLDSTTDDETQTEASSTYFESLCAGKHPSMDVLFGVDTSGSLGMLLSQQNSTDKQKNGRKSNNTKMLEKLATKMVMHIARHDFDHPDIKKYLIDDYAAYLEYQSKPFMKGREAFVENYRAFAKANPGYGLVVESIHADTNEKNGTSAVWMLLKVTGHPEGVIRESVTVQTWKRGDGMWKAHRQTGIRGVHVPGDVE
jgi:hypothetical protein